MIAQVPYNLAWQNYRIIRILSELPVESTQIRTVWIEFSPYSDAKTNSKIRFIGEYAYLLEILIETTILTIE
jgi:hypothetical protein